jgi:hypothetical protein
MYSSNATSTYASGYISPTFASEDDSSIDERIRNLSLTSPSEEEDEPYSMNDNAKLDSMLRPYVNGMTVSEMFSFRFKFATYIDQNQNKGVETDVRATSFVNMLSYASKSRQNGRCSLFDDFCFMLINLVSDGIEYISTAEISRRLSKLTAQNFYSVEMVNLYMGCHRVIREVSDDEEYDGDVEYELNDEWHELEKERKGVAWQFINLFNNYLEKPSIYVN